jgi:hypothetical protein
MHLCLNRNENHNKYHWTSPINLLQNRSILNKEYTLDHGTAISNSWNEWHWTLFLNDHHWLIYKRSRTPNICCWKLKNEQWSLVNLISNDLLSGQKKDTEFYRFRCSKPYIHKPTKHPNTTNVEKLQMGRRIWKTIKSRTWTLKI